MVSTEMKGHKIASRRYALSTNSIITGNKIKNAFAGLFGNMSATPALA